MSDAEVMTLWGRTTSMWVRKAVWAAEEVGRPYRRIDAGRQWGVVDELAYRRLNPNGRVPTLDDQGFVLWESNVIVRYLCARYGGALYPADIVARMEAERWMDWIAMEVFPAWRPGLNALARGLGDGCSPEEAKASLDQTQAFFAILDDRLAQVPYVAGDTFTMGDIPAGILVESWIGYEGRARLPNIERWFADVSARPAARYAMSLPSVFKEVQ